jgi:hypothetical protein
LFLEKKLHCLSFRRRIERGDRYEFVHG